LLKFAKGGKKALKYSNKKTIFLYVPWEKDEQQDRSKEGKDVGDV